MDADFHSLLFVADHLISMEYFLAGVTRYKIFLLRTKSWTESSHIVLIFPSMNLRENYTYGGVTGPTSRKETNLDFYPFPKRQIIDYSKLKEFADDNYKLNENGRTFSKLLVSSNFSFSCSVFKRLVVQTRKNQGLFGKGLTTLMVKALENIVEEGENVGNWQMYQ